MSLTIAATAPPAFAEAEQVRAFIDDEQLGWRSLGEKDFAKVNSADDTWSWTNGVLHCPGQPISVMRTANDHEHALI